MYLTKEHAASEKHPPRLDLSRCSKNNIVAPSLNQSSFGKNNTSDSHKGDKMSQELAKKTEEFSIIEQVVMQGDLSKLTPEQRLIYYNKVCESAGLNPLGNPFAYIHLNGKLVLYAKKDCTEQLRKINGVSIESLDDKVIDDIYVVTAKAKDKQGRIDQAKGAVVIGNLKGDQKANAIMKAETKAKRRVTLSICGMGWTDESEIDSIPNARPIDVDLTTGEIKNESLQPKSHSQIDLNVPKLSYKQVEELQMILAECDEKYRTWVYEYVKKQFGTNDLSGVPFEMYDRMKSAAVKNMEQNHSKQMDNFHEVTAEVK